MASCQKRLPWKSEVVLAEVEAVDVVVAAAHDVVLTRILLAQHEVVEDHQILVVGVDLSRVWHVFTMLEEKGLDAIRLGCRWQGVHHID